MVSSAATLSAETESFNDCTSWVSFTLSVKIFILVWWLWARNYLYIEKSNTAIEGKDSKTGVDKQCSQRIENEKRNEILPTYAEAVHQSILEAAKKIWYGLMKDHLSDESVQRLFNAMSSADLLDLVERHKTALNTDKVDDKTLAILD